MRKIIITIIVLSCYIFAKTEVSLLFGKNSFSGKENIVSPTSVGIRGDIYLDDLYHIDFGYDALGSVAYTNSNEKVKINRFYTQFSADGEEEYHVVPTLSIGAGFERQKGSSVAKSKPFLSLGIGFRYNISNNFNFVLGTKALWKTSDSAINYNGNVGLGYLFVDEPINNEKSAGEEVIIPKKRLDISTRKANSTMSKEIGLSKMEAPVVDLSQAMRVNSQKNRDIIDDKQRVLISNNYQKRRKYINKSSSYFIQVGAYSKYRPTSTLNKLAKKGYHIILRHNRNGITKILVGPYRTKNEALKRLTTIKRVVPQAFLYKGM